MKNIHLIPTDKPSRLRYFDSKLEIMWLIPKKSDIVFQNICITNDEEIKDGDWFLWQGYGGEWFKEKCEYMLYEGKKTKHLNCNYKIQFKVILTTDPDLIADGVQAIDDEFLEWFVKNPSCEEVEVEKDEFYSKKAFIEGKDAITFKYEIIIPQEVPKFGDSIKNSVNIMSIANDMFGKKEEPKQLPKTEVDWSRFPKSTQDAVGYKEEAKQEQKQYLIDLMRLDEQETLEEVSPMNDLLIDLKETKISVKESIDIIEDEFMRTQINIFVQKTLDSVIDRIENELLETESKWQQEQDKNKYSEEEVLDLLYKRDLYLLNRDEEIDLELPDKWFEQFKKK